MLKLYGEACNFANGAKHLIQPYISEVVAPPLIDKSAHTIGVAAVVRPEPVLRDFAKAFGSAGHRSGSQCEG